MKSSCRRAFSASGMAAWAVTTGLLGAVLTGPFPARAQTTAPVWTPYEKDPSMFHNFQEAIEALRSRDILLRRSGVEWLSQHTETYTPTPSSFALEVRQQLQSHPDLVPDLARAIREMPLQDSQQAARLLAVIGKAAQPGIPAICGKIASSDYGNDTPDGVKNLSAHIDLTTSLVLLCGGPDSVSTPLIPLLQCSNPDTRRVVAGTLRFRGDLLANRRLGSFDNYYLPPDVGRQRSLGFNRQAIPALALSLDDPVPTVRLAAAHSLEILTYDSGQAPWQKSLLPLTRTLASPDPVLRRTAARTLALVPTDTSPVASALRNALHGRDTGIVSYVVTALAHAAWSDPGKTLDAFLPDLKSTDLERRRLAATDIYRVESALWGSRLQAGYEPIPDEHNNINTPYNSRQMVWSLEVDEGTSPVQRVAKASWRRTAVAAAQNRLLAALVQATSDPDHAVRTDAARSLEKIGEWAYSGLESGYRPNPAVETRPQVIKALGAASEALRTHEPLLSNSLRELQARVTRGPDGAA